MVAAQIVYFPTPSVHQPTQARGAGCACTVDLHLSYLDAFQLHSCTCKHHRCNSNILQCCSLGLYEDTCIGGRHNSTNILQKAALVCAHRRLLSFFLSSSPRALLTKLRPFQRCVLIHPFHQDLAMKAAQQQDPHGFIRQHDCHDSSWRSCGNIITARCCAELSTVHSGNH